MVDIRPGDKLTFEVEELIRIANDGDYVIRFKGAFPAGNHIRPASILEHKKAPRPIEVGCRVHHKTNSQHIGEVRAVVGEKMWVDFGPTSVGEVIRYVSEYVVAE